MVNEEKIQSHCDLDLDQTKPNVQLVQVISIYYNRLKFQVDSQIIFLVIVYTDTPTQHTHTDLSTL